MRFQRRRSGFRGYATDDGASLNVLRIDPPRSQLKSRAWARKACLGSGGDYFVFDAWFPPSLAPFHFEDLEELGICSCWAARGGGSSQELKDRISMGRGTVGNCVEDRERHVEFIDSRSHLAVPRDVHSPEAVRRQLAAPRNKVVVQLVPRFVAVDGECAASLFQGGVRTRRRCIAGAKRLSAMGTRLE